MYLLRLYITGQSTTSQRAVKDLKSLMDEFCPEDYSCEVIDIFQSPQLAVYDQIMVTPTVIKLLPPPVIRLTGKFSDKEKIKKELGLLA